MPTMNRFSTVLLSGIFLLFLFCPLVLFLTQEKQLISTAEKRVLAKMPKLRMNASSLVNYPKNFTTYFKDHYGGRNFLIQLQNKVLYNVFRKSQSRLVIVGRDGWLFFDYDGALDDYMGKRQRPHIQLDQFRKVLEQRRDWLEQMGIHYLFLPVPNKMMVYDEFLPYRIRRHKAVSFYDQLMDTLKNHSDFVDYIDLKELFLKEKHTRQLYFRTDTHWNFNGSFLAQQAIAKHLQKWFPKLTPLTQDDLEMVPVDHSGDLAIMLNMQGYLVETAPLVKLKSPCSPEQTKKLNNFIHRNEQLRNNPLYLPEVNGCTKKELTALIICDSFGHFLRPYLSEFFKEVTYMHYADFNDMKDFILENRPDVVINQKVARLLGDALQPDTEEKQKMLSTMFNDTGKLALRIDGTTDLSSCLLNQVSISQNEDGITLDSNGNDPFLIYRFDNTITQGEALVKIALTSPVQTTLQLFYLPSGETQFSQYNSISTRIKKGLNEIYLPVFSPGLHSMIRIDPGILPGKYHLHSLLIKNFSLGKDDLAK